ncbi:MAG: family 78 glycoside hydrolase catalytic domain [bacterium]|nr:family 78 glycoside hydrolase catalytic domain [bacterium]
MINENVTWQTSWIWDAGTPAPRNYYLAARREFTLTDMDTRAPWRLHLTADTRYRVYLNGGWLGDGPARGFAHNWQFDTYDLTGLLMPGANVLAVIAQHWGEGTMQYAASGRAGLLAQLERGDGTHWTYVLGTDATWQVCAHTGFMRPMPRMSLQMAFVEAFDARPFADAWLAAGATPAGFQPASVIGPVGTPPWTQLSPRPTLPLTRTPHLPRRMSRTRLARPANLHFGFNLTPYLMHKNEGGIRELPGFVACIIASPVAQALRIWALDYFDWQEPPYLNGVQVESGTPAQLQAGENLLVCACAAGQRHVFDRSYAAMTEQPVTVHGVFQDASPFTVFGPIAEWATVRPQVIAARIPHDLEPWRAQARPIAADDVYSHGAPWAETTVSDTQLGARHIENAAALVSDGGGCAIIQPSDNGDPELTLDFGQVLVGWLEFEVDAPAGTILDFNGYEAIEDGRIHYTQGNQNGFRYITRAGRQRYTSMMRRGCRYVQLTVRNLRAPLRLHGVRLLFATHPAPERGAFACSDPLLTRIWDVGRHTLRCCSEDTYTDCPTYEQGFWVGDARNESLVDYAAFGNIQLPRRGIALAAESLQRASLPECCIPQTDVSILTAWSLLWVSMVEEHWQFTGARDWLAHIYPAVKTTLHNCRAQFTDARGLLSIAAWNMFDWAGMDSGHKCVAHNSMFLVEAYRRAASLAAALALPDDVAWYQAQRAALIAAINTHLWHEQRQAYVDALHEDGTPSPVVSQQNNALALLYDVASGARREAVRALGAAPPEGVGRVGSPFALFYVLEALAHDQRHEQMLRIVRQRWDEMLRKGATTFWEVFPGFEKDWWTRSHCHAWSAAPVYFLTRYQLGVWWAAPGYAHARIAPVPLDLTWAEGRVPTPHGEISVAWEQTPEQFAITIALPAAVAATVVLPVSATTFPQLMPADVAATQVDDRWHIALPAGAAVRLAAHARDTIKPA